MHEGDEEMYEMLVAEPRGMRPLEKSKHRWVANIKVDLKEIGLKGMDCIHLAQDMDQWQVLVNRVP
jgi:hypothetical protein